MSLKLRSVTLVVLLLVAGLVRADDSSKAPADSKRVSYHANVLPLLSRHCVDCHGVDQADSGFRVDRYRDVLKGGSEAGRAVVPGKPDDSPLLQFLTGKRTPRMPDKRKPLSDAEISVIRQWIEQGAIEGEPRQVVTFSEEQLEFFEVRIRPLLAQHCFECHGENKVNGNLAFTSRDAVLEGGTLGPAIVPGEPQKSLLIEAVRHTGKLRMPKNRARLDDASIELLEQWVAMGAPWPAVNQTDAPKIRRKFAIYQSDRDHWAFQPVVRPELPDVVNESWALGDIDRFILARLEAEKLAPATGATWAGLMRRLSFDLTGLPPTLKDLESFGSGIRKSSEGQGILANPTTTLSADSDAVAAYVDRLLASEEFGVHWARHWLDHVRYRPNQQKSEQNDPYRLWVVDALNSDMPYDQFLRMQIAGDLLPADSADEIHLDGLVAVRPWSLKSRHPDQIDLLGRTFMGLSLFCARCHDHKLEPISRDDYYAVQGIFESSQVARVPYLRDRSQYDDYMAGLQRTQANETRMKKELKKFNALAALVDLRGRLKAERAKLDDPAQDRNKVQQNVDRLLSDEKKRLADIEKRKIDINAPEAVEYMRLRRENNEFAARWKETWQFDAFVDQSDPEKITDAAPPMLGVKTKPGESAPTGDPVPRRFPTILAGFDQTPLGDRTKQSGRLELANWLTAPQHPITARLMTNRIWYYLLGEGLVPSLSNFGRSGRPPSHPELLDYLADEFVRNGWSMKQLIRRIVLSATYQQTSRFDAPRAELDQRLTLFGMARRKRLEAESILRTLNHIEYASVDEDRRRDPSVDLVTEARLLFDGANRNLIVPRRSSSVSPLQALFLMNSDHMKASTERIAARLYQLSDDDERIKQIHLLLYAREPTMEEIATSQAFLASWQSDKPKSEDNRRKPTDVPEDFLQRWQALLQVLLLTNEFLYVD